MTGQMHTGGQPGAVTMWVERSRRPVPVSPGRGLAASCCHNRQRRVRGDDDSFSDVWHCPSKSARQIWTEPRASTGTDARGALPKTVHRSDNNPTDNSAYV